MKSLREYFRETEGTGVLATTQVARSFLRPYRMHAGL